jgi:hypothetical protein
MLSRLQRMPASWRVAMLKLALLMLSVAQLLLSVTARATDWDLSLDMRLVNSDANRSLVEGGFGTVRFGSNDSGVQLGRARFALTQQLWELWSAHLDVSAWDDRDRSPVGVTEAYVQFRPYPRAGYRLRLKAGAFYPPVSLENRAAGWESPYSLSYSAIDSWLAVEVRTVGMEAQLDWLGTRSGHDVDLSATGGVFGWNERAGVALADDGFTLTDRQTPVFGRLGRPEVAPLFGALPFQQLDEHAGVYAGAEARYLDRVVLRVLRYDNRADPTQTDSVSHAIAWNTRFNSAGLRIESADGWTAIAQWLQGETSIAPAGMQLNWPFRAEFALLSRRFGRHTLSARYDHFQVDTNDPEAEGSAQRGHAWTAAYIFNASEHWRFTLEWLRVASSSYYRAGQGGTPFATETQLQLAIRYALGSGIR